MSYHYTPTLGNHVADYITTPFEGLEVVWEVPLEVTPYHGPSMSGPAEGGVEPAGDPTVVGCYVYTEEGCKYVEDKEVLALLGDCFPLADYEIEAAVEKWVSDDESASYAAYHNREESRGWDGRGGL